MIKVKMVCVGTKPLVMDPKTPEIRESIRSGISKPGPKITGISPEEEAKKKIIRENGSIGIPGEYLRGCIRNMAKMDKKYAKTLGYTSPKQVGSIITSLINVEEDFLPLTGSLKWVVDERPVPTAKGSSQISNRPKFLEWGFGVHLTILDDILKEEVAKRLVEESGICMGVAAARPLGFGRFKILKWEKIN